MDTRPTPRPRRRVDRVMARVLARPLDRRLAHGDAPEGSRLLAARAALITSARHRAVLADTWCDLLDAARQPRAYVDTRVPVSRAAVLAASPSISALVAALRGPAPVRAGDVARVLVLLGDGGSTLHAGGDLRREVDGLILGLQPGRADPWPSPLRPTPTRTTPGHGRSRPEGRGRG